MDDNILGSIFFFGPPALFVLITVFTAYINLNIRHNKWAALREGLSVARVIVCLLYLAFFGLVAYGRENPEMFMFAFVYVTVFIMVTETLIKYVGRLSRNTPRRN